MRVGFALEGRVSSCRVVDTRPATHPWPLARVLAKRRPIWLPQTSRVTSYYASTPAYYELGTRYWILPTSCWLRGRLGTYRFPCSSRTFKLAHPRDDAAHHLGIPSYHLRVPRQKLGRVAVFGSAQNFAQAILPNMTERGNVGPLRAAASIIDKGAAWG